MKNWKKRSIWALLITLCVSIFTLVLGTDLALAATITVSDVAYEIQISSGSFNDNSLILTNSTTAPWWGNSEAALAFASAYSNQAGTAEIASISTGSDYLLFAFEAAPNYVLPVWLDEAGNTFTSYLGPNDSYPFYSYATATVASAASVPEINAGALSQVFLILFAVWLVVSRRGSPMSVGSVQ